MNTLTVSCELPYLCTPAWWLAVNDLTHVHLPNCCRGMTSPVCTCLIASCEWPHVYAQVRSQRARPHLCTPAWLLFVKDLTFAHLTYCDLCSGQFFTAGTAGCPWMQCLCEGLAVCPHRWKDILLQEHGKTSGDGARSDEVWQGLNKECCGCIGCGWGQAWNRFTQSVLKYHADRTTLEGASRLDKSLSYALWLPVGHGIACCLNISRSNMSQEISQ